MAPTKASICSKCLRIAVRQRCIYPNHASLVRKRAYSDQAPAKDQILGSRHDEVKTIIKQEEDSTTASTDSGLGEEKNDAFTRRLEQMASDAIESSGRRIDKLATQVDSDAGFDEGLKRQLEERIRNSSFRSSNLQSFAISELPSHAGRGTRDIAGSRGWTGEEAVEDTALRMLVDAHKPLKGNKQSGSRILPVVPRPPTRKSTSVKAGTRLAEARDRSSAYTALRDNGMSKEEREAYFREVRARFQPGARDLPATLTGLASLANERIEEAMARGQFKNLPRGQKLERDHNSSNPFLDTTEYIMNNMIKKQDIVPPWIEKQQELALAARRFRSRLRSDWRRHAARMIASKGGSLEEQIQRALEHGAAELIENPPNGNQVVSESISEDHLSQISQSGELNSGSSGSSESHDAFIKRYTDNENRPRRSPFRDPDWEATELSFHKLSIDNLNSITRTYNLMAPRPAQKPYFNLQRELKNCYRDVAPQIGNDIRERALAPKKVPEYKLGSNRPSGLLEAVVKTNTKVYDEDLNKKGYGIKEFWRDLWDSGRGI